MSEIGGAPFEVTESLSNSAIAFTSTASFSDATPKGVRLALHGKGGVRHAATNWVKQCDASTMCRPLESTAVRLATNRQGTSLDNAIETR
jgi:hypothetical protein